jgi:hypothetical protein
MPMSDPINQDEQKQKSPREGGLTANGAPCTRQFEHPDPLAGEDRGPVGSFVMSGINEPATPK